MSAQAGPRDIDIRQVDVLYIRESVWLASRHVMIRKAGKIFVVPDDMYAEVVRASLPKEPQA